jgi:hypothetical protein
MSWFDSFFAYKHVGIVAEGIDSSKMKFTFYSCEAKLPEAFFLVLWDEGDR